MVPAKPNKSAFTLIELLVVIAIIGVLAAHQATCLSNHRQLILGWSMYADDHSGQLAWTVDDGDGQPFTNWVAGNLRYPAEAANTALLIDQDRTLLAQYVPNAKVYKCPADKSKFARSVAMNNRMNPIRPGREPLVLGGHGTNFMVYRRTSQMRAPPNSSSSSTNAVTASTKATSPRT